MFSFYDIHEKRNGRLKQPDFLGSSVHSGALPKQGLDNVVMFTALAKH